jgi:hypothetical protein
MRTAGLAELDESLDASLVNPGDPGEIAAFFERQAGA